MSEQKLTCLFEVQKWNMSFGFVHVPSIHIKGPNDKEIIKVACVHLSSTNRLVYILFELILHPSQPLSLVIIFCHQPFCGYFCPL